MEDVSETAQKAFSLSEECVWLVTDHANHAQWSPPNADNVPMDLLTPTEDV